MTLSLPAVRVQEAMTTRHKGNVNSSSAGFQSEKGSHGGLFVGDSQSKHGASAQCIKPSKSQIMLLPIQLFH